MQQIISRVDFSYITPIGAALAEPHPDFSHTALTWPSESASFFGQDIHDSQALRAALDLAADNAGASPICIWPHHFDMATLISLPSQKDGDSKSVGLGFLPAMQESHSPIGMSPPGPIPIQPTCQNLLVGGNWHTAGWVGALQKQSLLEQATKAEQINQFLTSALYYSKALLEKETQ